MQLTKFLPKYHHKHIEYHLIVASIAICVNPHLLKSGSALHPQQPPMKKANLNPLFIACVDDSDGNILEIEYRLLKTVIERVRIFLRLPVILSIVNMHALRDF